MRQLRVTAKSRISIFRDKKNFLRKFMPREPPLFLLISTNNKKSSKRSWEATTSKIIKVKYKTSQIR
jgi:hypothetical protein